ncbi:MAG: peptide deformylase [Clostridia bacterium]|nr:peptide deformylase [Clostridia bacterium]
MAILNIVKDGDEILRKISREVKMPDPKIDQLLEDMKETMAKAGGVGLAAVQVGKLRRVIVIDTGEEQLELINPVKLSEEGVQEELEGCLSCPGQWGVTRRPMKVTVETLDRKGDRIRYTGEGLMAKAICHEMDHLDGKLFYDEAIHMLTPEELEEYEKG